MRRFKLLCGGPGIKGDIVADYGPLFEPIDIGGMRVPSRIVMASLYTNMATESGAVTQQMIDYYAERARGGVGLIITEATCVDWHYSVKRERDC